MGVVGQVTVSPWGVALALSLTVPAKLKMLVRVTLTPVLRLPPAVMVKSPTWIVATVL